MIHPFCGELKEPPGAVASHGAGQICSELGVLCLIRSGPAGASHELGFWCYVYTHLGLFPPSISKLRLLIEFTQGHREFNQSET